MVIWVGMWLEGFFMNHVACDLAARGVYCISYQSEPTALHNFGCAAELWDYSHANALRVRNGQSLSKPIRVVPPGFVERFPPPPTTPGPVETFVFVGGKRCQKMPADIQARVKYMGGVWTYTDWEKLASKNNTAFLTVHKACGVASSPLESFRLSSILSFGGVLIAEPSDSRDMAMYDGIMIVEPDFYAERWSTATLELLQDGPRLAAWRDRAFARYKSRFDPRELLTQVDAWNERS